MAWSDLREGMCRGFGVSVQGYWADVPSPQLRDLPGDLVVVLPVGAIEQHGPHLPLSVDRDLVDAVVQRTLGALDPAQNVLILPTLAVTKSGEHDGFPGTLSLTAETLLAVLRDIGASLSRAGVERLVVFNGHGGNAAVLEIAARELRMREGMIVGVCSWFGFADTGAAFPGVDLSHDIHAGVIETSAMLAARPDRVDMGAAQNFEPAMAGWGRVSADIGLSGQAVRPGWVAEDLNPEGACGDAAAATVAAGEVLLDSAAQGFAGFLRDFARFDHRGEAR